MDWTVNKQSKPKRRNFLKTCLLSSEHGGSNRQNLSMLRVPGVSTLKQEIIWPGERLP